MRRSIVLEPSRSLRLPWLKIKTFFDIVTRISVLMMNGEEIQHLLPLQNLGILDESIQGLAEESHLFYQPSY